MQNNRVAYSPSRYKDSHHIVPVALKGYDVPQNIAEILRTDHELIHQTLDMNSRLFYNLSRLAKVKTNHKMVMSPDDLQYWYDVQNVYFERLGRLPTQIKKLHIDKMNELVRYENDRLSKITKVTKPTISQNFDAALLQYHDYGKEIAKVLHQIIKNHL